MFAQKILILLRCLALMFLDLFIWSNFTWKWNQKKMNKVVRHGLLNLDMNVDEQLSLQNDKSRRRKENRICKIIDLGEGGNWNLVGSLPGGLSLVPKQSLVTVKTLCVMAGTIVKQWKWILHIFQDQSDFDWSREQILKLLRQRCQCSGSFVWSVCVGYDLRLIKMGLWLFS